MHTLLNPLPPKPLALPRSVATVAAELRRRAVEGELTLPEPGHGQTPQRWSALAALGRTDLTLARLAEGHVDALAILAEAGRDRPRTRSTACGRPRQAAPAPPSNTGPTVRG